MASSPDRFVERILKLENPDVAIEGIINSEFFPRILTEKDFGRLPDLLKVICNVWAFIINSGASGLVGLFSDSSTRLALVEIQASLQEIGARRACAFLKDLEMAVPGGEFPTNAAAADRVLKALVDAEVRSGKSASKLARLMAEYPIAASMVTEELRQYLKANRAKLVEAFAASAR